MPTLKSALGANFVVLSLYNCPTAPNQYRKHTARCGPCSVQRPYARHRYHPLIQTTVLDFLWHCSTIASLCVTRTIRTIHIVDGRYSRDILISLADKIGQIVPTCPGKPPTQLLWKRSQQFRASLVMAYHLNNLVNMIIHQYDSF